LAATATSNKVRIGGGEWRSRLLRFPDAHGLRPTPDRVRQTLFNWLGQEMSGRACLDLFAGSGALGFEALSRGAASVTMVEQSLPVFRALLENAGLLKTEKARILRADAQQFLAQDAQTYDVIFLDPPFGMGWLEKLLPLLARHLAPDGLVYAETEYAFADSESWHAIKRGRAGNVYYCLLQLTHGTPYV
jgi:16S rRNA (guanine966-N2)-methyltransferase